LVLWAREEVVAEIVQALRVAAAAVAAVVAVLASWATVRLAVAEYLTELAARVALGEAVAVAAVAAAEETIMCMVPMELVAQVSLFFAGTINIGN
jgi:hypothetical protein